MWTLYGWESLFCTLTYPKGLASLRQVLKSKLLNEWISSLLANYKEPNHVTELVPLRILLHSFLFKTICAIFPPTYPSINHLLSINWSNYNILCTGIRGRSKEALLLCRLESQEATQIHISLLSAFIEARPEYNKIIEESYLTDQDWRGRDIRKGFSEAVSPQSKLRKEGWQGVQRKKVQL